MARPRRPPRRIPGAVAAALALGAVALLLTVPPGVRGAATGRGNEVAAAGGANLTISGTVVDDYADVPLPNVTVRATELATFVVVHADAEGRFALPVQPGSVYLTVDPPSGYSGYQTHVRVANASVGGLVIGLVPSALLAQLDGPGQLDAPTLLGILAAVVGGCAGAAAAIRQRRIAAGGSGRLATRFARYVAFRAALIPGQLLGVLIVLYIFGTYLPAIVRSQRGSCLSLNGASCAPCDPTVLGCQVSTFSTGLGSFLVSILSGQWGVASLVNLRLPATTFIAWWLPDSLELAAVALLLSVVIGYPLGLASGWRADGPLDRSLRGLSMVLLLVPTFLVVLFLSTGIAEPWYAHFGELPFGLLPSQQWYLANGGFPSWIGIGGNTSPTGFPLVDGAIHGDWPFVVDVGAKLLLQALAIALIYVSIFFRFARHAVSEAAGSEAIRAARSRGVPEATLRWDHAGRRVLPVLLLIFGMTLPAYLGTQAIVEVLFNDTQGFGTILFSEMTQVGRAGFGLQHAGANSVGNLYQVTILFLALLLLVGNLCADVLARYLDHSLDSAEDR